MRLSALPGIKRHPSDAEESPWPDAQTEHVWIVDDTGMLSGSVYWVLVDELDEVIGMELISMS